MVTYDLTQPLDANTPIFPGDPVFKFDSLYCLECDDKYALKHLHFCNHAGTHIDFPSHVIKGGKTSSDYSVEHFIGDGVVLEHDGVSDGKISSEFINKNAALIHNKIVFFKKPVASNKATYLDEAGARLLVEHKVKIVGVDSLSIDHIDSTELPAHMILLAKNILIVEGLSLVSILAGAGEIIIAPLNIPDMDGLPARVIMRR